MRGKIKDPGQCCHTNRGENAETITAPETQLDNIIIEGDRQPGYIENLLPIGAGNAIPTAQLVKLTGFKTVRDLQKQIEAERLSGALILSKSRYGGGYFLPSEGQAGQFEIADYVNTLTARAVSTFKTLSAARRALKRIEGQIPINEE